MKLFGIPLKPFEIFWIVFFAIMALGALSHIGIAFLISFGMI